MKCDKCIQPCTKTINRIFLTAICVLKMKINGYYYCSVCNTEIKKSNLEAFVMLTECSILICFTYLKMTVDYPIIIIL